MSDLWEDSGRLVLLHEILLWSLFGQSLPSPLSLVAVSAAVKNLDRKSVRPGHANDSAFCLTIVSLRLVSTNLSAGHVGKKQLTHFIYLFTLQHLWSAFLFYSRTWDGYFTVWIREIQERRNWVGLVSKTSIVFCQPQTQVVIVTTVTACWPHTRACGWSVFRCSDVRSR